MPHRVLTIEQVAGFLHVAVADVEALVHHREIPFERQGRRIVFRKAEIDEWASRRILGLAGKKLENYHQDSSRGMTRQFDTASVWPCRRGW